MKYTYYIDAGVEHLHLCKYQESGEKILDVTIKVDDAIEAVFKKNNLWSDLKQQDVEQPAVFVTGKLSAIIIKTLGFGREFMPAAAFWSAAKFLLKSRAEQIVGIIDLSASGYMAISIDRDGVLVDDNLVVNPRCGAGSGTNLSRILQKLNIKWSEVDQVLESYLGEAAQTERLKISIRADRCGVFSSSATISDKNQGIPLKNALAVTLKSEVYKAVKKISAKSEVVYLTGRVFHWQFARECAKDYLTSVGVKEVLFDENQDIVIDGLKNLVESVGLENIKPHVLKKIAKEESVIEYPGFAKLFEKYSQEGVYLRDKESGFAFSLETLGAVPVVIGLDVGSTMAKIAIANAVTHELLYLDSFDNHGDTIETIKFIFKSLFEKNIKTLNIQQIGVTGSGRYQIQKVLRETYPYLRDRIEVLVENYAHARGSLQEVKEHIAKIKNRHEAVNEEFCLLVDVGGEDTKISVISLKNEDLYDNAMNIKCSAGTGSLIDTLRSMFGVESVKVACEHAMLAGKSYGINATCAVFLIENARKLQAQGFDQKEILASCYWAIVENMSRTLWSQIDFPKNTVTLLHGQTMLSDPLPLAVTHRLQEYTGSKTYAYVPPFPGHRACLGLIKGLEEKEIIAENCDLSLFINREFAKQIFICHGAACGDKNASCSRSMLSYVDQAGAKKFIALGGCTSVNEREALILQGVQKDAKKRDDVYRDIWQMFDDALPKEDADNRLVIPRSFAGSEQAFFFAKIFSHFKIPVFVDNVAATDILEAQPRISIDTCAPVIGAVGQFSRLARENRGVVFVPQLDFLPTGSASLGRTCTTNQGGVVIAMNMAREINPDAKFILTDISIHEKTGEKLAVQLLDKFRETFAFYNISANLEEMRAAITSAVEAEKDLRRRMCELAAERIVSASEAGKQIVIVSGREYILNPAIYDSHVGRLFSDKGAVAIPAYIFNGELESEFSSIYWRNPHHLLGIVRATEERRLGQLTTNKKLSEALTNIESDKQKQIGVIFVSTFRCGPDSMILQTAQEVAKNIPFLVIQSDAAINELAHLENRVNTYLNQLKEDLENGGQKKPAFKVEFLDKFTASALNKKEDVLYFPTMEDNRAITSVMRAAGYVCVDNYQDGEYDLQRTIKFGRRFAGDTVCAPFAAVLADTMLAVADFIERKKRGELQGLKKIVIFNNKGTGPCRQGQYYETHRLLLHRELEAYLRSLSIEDKNFDEIVVQYIVGHEKNNYNIGLESWALVQAFQALVMQGVLHGVFLESGRVCNTIEDYDRYRADFLELKQKVFAIFENVKPGATSERLLNVVGKIPGVNLLAMYYLTGLAKNNGLRDVLKDFADRWKIADAPHRELKIYAEGEAYMRVAQIEEVYKNLIDDLGIGSFEFSYSPVWLYFEYLLEHQIMQGKEKKNTAGNEFKNVIKNIKTRLTVIMFRKIFVSPLYKASSLHEPELMKNVLERARLVLPTNKPYGELAPYVGEALLKLDSGTELFLNVAPEGCMVATMGEMLTNAIYNSSSTKKKNARIQGLFSTDGEVDNAKLIVVLLKILGPERYYSLK